MNGQLELDFYSPIDFIKDYKDSHAYHSLDGLLYYRDCMQVDFGDKELSSLFKTESIENSL